MTKEAVGDLTIPSWFQWITSLAITVMTVGGVPWASWVTYTLIVIQQRTERVEEHHIRITSIERTLESHSAQFQVIAATRFTSEQGRIFQSSLERLDMKLDKLAADIIDVKTRTVGSSPRPPQQPPAHNP